MISHQQIDSRLLGMVRLCVEKLDTNPSLRNKVWANASHIADPRLRRQWETLRATPWSELRNRLLAETDEGDQIRQNVPFGGLLSNAERLQFFQKSPP